MKKITTNRRIAIILSERHKFALAMKLSVFLMLVFSLQATASSFSQVINYSSKDKPFTEVLTEIKKQTGFNILYNNKIIQNKQKVSIHAVNMPLDHFLNKLLSVRGMKYSIETNNILITMRKSADIKDVSELKELVQEDKYTLIGKVTDDAGKVLEGVNVKVKGGQESAKTSSSGQYIIEVNASSTLVFSFVGFLNKEVKVENRKLIDVVLTVSQKDLEEVVVVAFGTQKKESVVGAITSISPTVLQQNQTRSITNSLAGQAAGIIAVQRSGEPGYDNSDFWIRGINTFGDNKKPLILIDGIERSLNNISPEEIASFSILKDAAATAVYGVRGANGVILVQTKRGKIGKTSINVKSDYGFSTTTKLPSFVDAPTYMEIVNEAFKLSYLEPIYKQERIDNTRNNTDLDLFPNVNWLQEVTREKIPTHRVSLDVNGGTELLRYSLIAAYHSEEGVIKTDPAVAYDSQLKLNKYNLRSNVDLRLTNSTNMSLSLGGYIMNRNAPGIDVPSILSRAFNTPPNYHPPMYSNGQIPQVGARYNPWADAVHSGFQKRYESNVESLLALKQDWGLVWEQLEGLTMETKFSFDAYNWNTVNRTKTPTTYLAYGRDDEGKLLTSMTNQGQEFLGYGKGAGGNRAMYFESKVNYEKNIDKHYFGSLLLFYLRDYVNADAGNAISSLPYRNQGLAGRASYNYDNRYFLEFNFGYNGSENFAKGMRFGFFPSVAAGWLLTHEEFMQPLKNTLTNLKIRGSYGLVGNDKLGGRRFSYLSTIESRPGYSFGYSGEYGLGGWGVGEFGVDNLTWETARKLNVGLDIGLWNELLLNIDVFKERRDNIFMQRRTIPELGGYDKMPWANYGVVSNHGLELNLEYTKNFNKDLNVSVRGSYTYARNKVVEIDEAESIQNTTRSRTNSPLNQHFGLTAMGLYKAEDFIDVERGMLKPEIPQPFFGIVRPGDIRYVDTNKDGKVDSYDETPIGRPYVPEVVYGFGFTLRYKRFDIGTFFQGTAKFTNMLTGGTLIPGSGAGGTGNIYANVGDRWTPENPREDVLWPRLSNNTSENNMRASTWWMKNSAFLRMKNFEMGYTIKAYKQQAKGLKNARVFFRGSNLVTFSEFDMWDPEIGSSDGLKYPLNKIYAFGLDILF